MMDLLKSQLSEPHYKLVEQLVDTIYRAQCFECESYYKLGFATGMVIDREVRATERYFLSDEEYELLSQIQI